MAPPRRFQVRQLQPVELAGPLREQALWVFGGALGFPRRGTRVLGFADTVRRHALLGGFEAFGAFNVRGRLVGFSYGYTSKPGLWWREQIAQPMTSAQRDYWLADAFEFAELHVHPVAQGRGLGSRLHDSLIAGQHHRTAVLSVMHRSQRAKQLYQSRGWQALVDELRFSTEPQTAFSVLGLRLRLPH
jgi:ribosomal protein S18 acetylase RimI-like enzyme